MKFQSAKKSSAQVNWVLPMELSNCSLVACSELQPMLVPLSALNAPVIRTAQGRHQLVVGD